MWLTGVAPLPPIAYFASVPSDRADPIRSQPVYLVGHLTSRSVSLHDETGQQLNIANSREAWQHSGAGAPVLSCSPHSPPRPPHTTWTTTILPAKRRTHLRPHHPRDLVQLQFDVGRWQHLVGQLRHQQRCHCGRSTIPARSTTPQIANTPSQSTTPQKFQRCAQPTSPSVPGGSLAAK